MFCPLCPEVLKLLGWVVPPSFSRIGLHLSVYFGGSIARDWLIIYDSAVGSAPMLSTPTPNRRILSLSMPSRTYPYWCGEDRNG